MFYELTFVFYAMWGIEVINSHSSMVGISLLSIYLLCFHITVTSSYCVEEIPKLISRWNYLSKFENIGT